MPDLYGDPSPPTPAGLLPCGHPAACRVEDHDREEPQSWCAWCQDVADRDGLHEVIRQVEQERDAAARFKLFVHQYLTQHGVPEGDPENPHQKEGCRIGARLDLLLAERDRLRADKAELLDVLRILHRRRLDDGPAYPIDHACVECVGENDWSRGFVCAAHRAQRLIAEVTGG